MSTLSKLIEDIDFAVLKTADKDIYDAYQGGKLDMRKNFTSDIEFLQNLLRSFFDHYGTQIKELPEQEKQIEMVKIKLAQDQLDSIVKIFTTNKNYLDKNLFMFYTLAYVNDIVRRHSGGS